jgi:hypothetical protein
VLATLSILVNDDAARRLMLTVLGGLAEFEHEHPRQTRRRPRPREGAVCAGSWITVCLTLSLPCWAKTWTRSVADMLAAIFLVGFA